MRSESELPLSAEMINLLDRKLTDVDDDGCLPDDVSSVLALPMSGISTFCPTAAILESKYTSTRMPQRHEIEEDALMRRGFSAHSLDGSGKLHPPQLLSSRLHSTRQSGFTAAAFTAPAGNGFFSGSFHDLPSSPTSPATHFSAMPADAYRQSGMLTPSQLQGQLPASPKIHDSKSRLEVLWLRRQAQLAREDGKGELALQLLERALQEHLGSGDYSTAKLADPIISSDPQQLLDNIDSQYYIYDGPVHLQAAKVQRCFHKKFQRKTRMVTHIARAFRGFMARKRIRKHREILRQCAVLLQRRFRLHLRRMHRLATAIKRWFQLMKIVREYKRRLRVYCMARRIQRLFRGNRGRARAAMLRLRLRSCMCIQRTVRAYAVRRDRAFAIRFFHRIYFNAARVVQHFVRRKQAVERAQMKLLIELARENVRARKERIVVEEALRMQKIWDNFYTKSDPGRVHMEHVDRQLQVQRQGLREVRVSLAPDEIASQRAISVLEQFDDDGTGSIFTKRLPAVLQRLCIAANHEKLLHLRTVLDPEDVGFIPITDFMEWFESEDADEFIEPDTVVENMRRLQLEVRRKLRALHIQRHQRKLRKEYHRRHCMWLTKVTINTFRFTHPPKFQCCQCLAAFVMFTDYYLHFDRATGCCGVSGQKAMYLPRYWVRADWARQRQIEAEVIRINDEHPFVRHHARRRCFVDIALRRSSPVRGYHKQLIAKAYELYKDDYLQRSLSDIKERTVHDVEQLVTACSGKSVSDFGADVIMRSLSLPVSSRWIVEEFASTEQLVQWLSERLPAEMAAADAAAGVMVTTKSTSGGKKQQQPLSPAKTTTSSSSKKNKKAAAAVAAAGGSASSKKSKKAASAAATPAAATATQSADPAASGALPAEDSPYTPPMQWRLLPAMRTPRFMDAGKIKRRCLEMAVLHVGLLRIMQAEAQASLMALTEFRARRPRRSSTPRCCFACFNCFTCFCWLFISSI